jgi:hypothetical protein
MIIFNVFFLDLTYRIQHFNVTVFRVLNLRNKSWKPECVGSFNMDWRILVFYPEPEAKDKIYSNETYEVDSFANSTLTIGS